MSEFNDLVQEGRPPTQDEQIALLVFDEGIKQSITRLNESINRIITLATAMVAGALCVLKDDFCTGWGRVAAAIFFFVALAVAILGSIPYLAKIEREMSAINAEIDRVAKWKRRLLTTAYSFLLAGFLAAIMGTTWRIIVPIAIPTIPLAR